MKKIGRKKRKHFKRSITGTKMQNKQKINKNKK